MYNILDFKIKILYHILVRWLGTYINKFVYE